MSLETKTKVIFLDACRDNPSLIKSLSKGRGAYRGGLAPAKGSSFDDQGSGIFIAYATDSGNVALDSVGQSNSPFTSALLRHMKDPVSIDDMFSMVTKEVRQQTQNSQKPYKYASLDGIVCLPGSCGRVKSDGINTSDALETMPKLNSTKNESLPTAWVLMNSQLEPHKALVYINPSSIKREGSRVSYATKWVHQKDSALGLFSSKVGYDVITYAADCEKYLGSAVEIDQYDSNDLKLSNAQYGNFKTIQLSADYSKPSSIGYAAIQLSCNPDRHRPLIDAAGLSSEAWERFFTFGNSAELYYLKSSIKKGKDPEILTKLVFKRIDLSKLQSSVGIRSGFEGFDYSEMATTYVSKSKFICAEEKTYEFLGNYFDEDGRLVSYTNYQDLPPNYISSLLKIPPENFLWQLSKLACQ